MKGGKGVWGGRGLGFEVGGELVADGLDDERRRRWLAVAPQARVDLEVVPVYFCLVVGVSLLLTS